MPVAGFGAVMRMGADSQCALTITMPVGLGIDVDHANSSSIHGPSSKSGGAPWLM